MGGFIRAGSNHDLINCNESISVSDTNSIQQGGFIRTGSPQQFYYCPSSSDLTSESTSDLTSDFTSELSQVNSGDNSSYNSENSLTLSEETTLDSAESVSQSGGNIQAGSNVNFTTCESPTQSNYSDDYLFDDNSVFQEGGDLIQNQIQSQQSQQSQSQQTQGQSQQSQSQQSQQSQINNLNYSSLVPLGASRWGGL